MTPRFLIKYYMDTAMKVFLDGINIKISKFRVKQIILHNVDEPYLINWRP